MTPALGYYDPKVLERGGISVNSYGLIDGVTEKYVVCDIDGDFTLNIYGGTEFHPYASQPAVSQKDVYFDSEARLSYRLNATDAIYYHSLLGGEKSTDPKFKKEMTELGYDAEVITTNFTINRVFLQRYNEVTNTYKNTGIDFAVSAVSDVTFNDSEKNIGNMVKYRLVIVFDGVQYASEPFTVTWTENQEDISEPVVNMVELHVAHAGSNDFEGGKFVGGDARLRLDAEHPYYYYTVADGKSHVGKDIDLFHSTKYGENPVKVAEFDYHTGVLTFYGTSYAVDFNGDDKIKTEDGERGNLNGEILGIRVSDDSAEGGLIINVAGNTTIGGCCDNYGWVSDRQYYVGDSVINNEYGFIRIKGKDTELNLIRTSRSHEIEGILAYGDVYLEGSVTVNIPLGADESITVSADADRYGIYSVSNVIIRDTVVYRYTGIIENASKCLKGESVAVFAENGKLTMLDDAWAIIYSGAKYKEIHGDYNAICVDQLNVVQNSAIDLRVSGDVNVPIFASNNILFATTTGVWIRCTTDPIDSYGVSCGDGTFEVRYPTTLVYENEYNRDLMKEGDEDKFILIGKYTHYRKPGIDKYFPGDNHRVSVVLSDDMGYYFSRYDYTIEEPDTTALMTGFHYKDNMINVRVDDTVTYLAKEPRYGFTFDGWRIVCAVELENLKYDNDGREISFTMPDYDVTLYPMYRCTAFDENPVCLVVREQESKHATLYWQFDASKNLQSARLEKWVNGEWVELEWTLTVKDTIDYIGGKTTYRGEQALKVAGAEGEGMEISDIGTYRIHAVSDDGYFAGYNLYSEAFVIDFEGGVHILASEDAFDPTIIIPAGDIGTKYILYLGDYLYSDYDLDYEFNFGKWSEAVESGVIGFTLKGRVATFKRNAVLEEMIGETNARITVTDSMTGRVFYIPFVIGEIYDVMAYPVYVNGKQINENNCGDVFGDGTVSYDPNTNTLTLTNANITDLYSTFMEYNDRRLCDFE